MYTQKNRLTISLLIIFVTIANGTFAQKKNKSTSVDTIKINLQTALDTAVARYPLIRASLAEKKSVNEQVKSSHTAYLPSLQLQEQLTYGTVNSLAGQYYSNEGAAISTSGGINPTQNWNAVSSQFTTAVLTGPIFAFGKINANIKEKEAQLKIADAEYQNEIFQHKIKVTEAYLYLLVYQKLRVAQAQNLKRASDVNKLIKASVSSGLKPGVDSSYSAAEQSKAHITYLASLRDEKTWQIKFGEFIGMPNTYFITDSMAFNSTLPNVDIAQNSTDNNPLITIYKSKIESDLFSAKTIKRSYLPTLKYIVAGSARGSGLSNTGIYSSNFSDGVQFSRYNYVVGAYFLWNVMDIFRVTHNYKSSMYQVQKDNALLDETRLNLNSQLENANVQLSLAIEQAKEAPIQLRAASAGFNQSKARYESGLGNLLELSQNLYILARAEADYSITYNNTWRSLLSIAASTGDMNLFLNSIKTK